MESFAWSTNFETGIETVDDQHRVLVDIINSIGEQLFVDDMSNEAFAYLLTKLIHYAGYHFEEEERLMVEHSLDYRHCAAHIAEHKTFVDDILLQQKQKSFGETKDNLQSLLDYLIHWLAYHILGMDKNMARQLAAIERGETPFEAWSSGEREVDATTEPLLTALKGLFELVSKRNRELALLNQNLEWMVAERTRDLVKANEDLELLAMTDVLTDLPNRRHAMRQMRLFWQESASGEKPLGCIMVDADGFKKVNDTLGHDVGDLVLKRLAQELSHAVHSDDIVCRLGGDEFLVLCQDTPLPGLLQVAKTIRARIADLQVRAGDGVWPGSVSIGVAVQTDSVTSIDQLLKMADDGVYMAKRAGKNTVRSCQDPTFSSPRNDE